MVRRRSDVVGICRDRRDLFKARNSGLRDAHYLSEQVPSLVLNNNRGGVYRGRMKIEVPER